METIKLYRIEKDGIGPFCHPDRYENEYLMSVMEDIGNDEDRHPVPFEDMLIGKWTKVHGFPDYMHCAVASMESLEDWFCGAFDALDGAGFMVAEIVVAKDDAVIGETQVIYDSDKIIDKKFRAISEAIIF